VTEADSVADELPAFRRMPFPEALEWLAEHGEPADPRPDIDTASLVQRFPRLAGVTTTDVALAGTHGEIPLRAYVDHTAPPTGRGLVWVHGGGFIGGHLDMPESNWVALELASRGIPVLAVDYTKCLAGIHFPIPADDVDEAWAYATATAPDLLGVDPGALALGGASAGSTLAAGAVTQLIAAGADLPASLVLVYPVLHPNGPEASTDVDPDSPISQLTLNYAGTVEALTEPRVFAGVGDGSGFPPTLVVVCEADALRPSGEAFVATLQRAGRVVQLHLEPGAEHGHINRPGDVGALRTIDAMSTWLSAPSFS
jgi:acetyl esterase